MADEKPAGVSGTISGWIKAAVTSVIGLLSGLAIMYLTPVVNQVIKPAKPVSNFATQITGLTVQFNNRSTGGIQGWWDFGDGTALEPFDPKLETVKHTFAKPGTYSVKLTLSNLLGEENDRTAQVAIDADATPAGPEIAQFDLVPLDKTRERAPAIYRLLSRVKNANFCILSCGDTRPMEVIPDAANQERYVTFDEMGSYTVRLAAVNGKQLVEQTKTIFVGPNDSNDPTAKLLVTYEAVKVERLEKVVRIHCGWQGDTTQKASAFRKERPVDPDCKVISAELVNNITDAKVRNVKWEVSPDKSKVIVSGELQRPTGNLPAGARAVDWVAEMKVVMERRSGPRSINRGDVAMSVNLKGTITLPMQPLEKDYEIVRKQVSLQLWDGERKAWEGSKGVTNAKVMLNNQSCLVTAIPQQDSFVLTIAPMATPGPIRPVSFERNPLFLKKPS